MSMTSRNESSSRHHYHGSSVSEDTKTVAGNIKSAASEMADRASGAVSDLADSASKKLETAADQASGVISGAAASLKNQAGNVKSLGADAVSGLATGVRGIADGIENQSPQVAGLARDVADGADNLSRQIRDQDVGELFDAVTTYSRKHPAVAIGFGMFAGLLLSRLLSSGRNS